MPSADSVGNIHKVQGTYKIQLGLDNINFALGEDFEYICISRHDKEELAVSLIKQQFFPKILVKTNVHLNWTILS
jgi:hypothetical protein